MTLHFDATDSDLALFLEEAAEQLETLSSGLLRMEREAHDPSLIQAVFRAAHTLKGSSATIGHHRMANLTHAMESVLDHIRQGRLTVTTVVIDTLLAAVDALHLLNQEVITREPGEVAVEVLIERLHQVASAEASRRAATTPPSETLPAVTGAEQAGVRGFVLDIGIDPTSQWPAVRAYQALMELAVLGQVVNSWPDERQLQAGECAHTLRVLLATDQEAAALEAAVRTVSEITTVTLTPVSLAELRASPAARDDRRADLGPKEAGEETDRRRVDLGPEMRGASLEDQLTVAGARLAIHQRMVKVDIGRLDEMMNLVGELVIDRGRLLQVLRALSEQHGSDPALEQLTDITQHLARVSDDLQQQVMLSRLLPVESVFNRFPRMVRDLAKRSGKLVRFIVEGQETGLDRSVIDEIADPLVHLLRNALDHGVEPPEERRAAGKPEEATIHLSARHEESMIVLEVKDDGRGIDPQKMRQTAVRKGILSAETAGRLSDEEAINLIFAPGFSTAAQVTDVSGRGVGMDIVRTNIEKINGSIKVTTRLGEGTTFTIRLPLTLAIIRALLVRVGEAIFTIPLASVEETLRIRTSTIHTVQRREVALVRGHALPLVRLADIFARPGQEVERQDGEWMYVVSVRTGRTDLGLIVDGLIGEQEVVIKSMDGVIADIEGLAGATILGDGSVSMIVDVPKVVERLAPRLYDMEEPAPDPRGRRRGKAV